MSLFRDEDIRVRSIAIDGVGKDAAFRLVDSADNTIFALQPMANKDVGVFIQIPTTSVNSPYGGAPWTWTKDTQLWQGVTNDNILAWGYNIGPGGVPVVSGKPTMYYQTEIDFNDGVDHWMEHHFDYTFDGLNLLRPFAIGTKLNDNTYCDIKFSIGSNTSNQFAIASQGPGGASTVLLEMQAQDGAIQLLKTAGVDNATQFCLRTGRNAGNGEARLNYDKSNDQWVFTNTGTGSIKASLPPHVGVGLSGQATTALYVQVGTASDDAMTIAYASSSPSGVMFSANAAGIPRFRVLNASAFVNNGIDLKGFSDNQSTQKWIITGSTGDAQFNTLKVVAAAPSVSAGQVAIGATTATTVGAAGGATALPATPLGYLIVNVAGTQAKIPYYNN